MYVTLNTALLLRLFDWRATGKETAVVMASSSRAFHGLLLGYAVL